MANNTTELSIGKRMRIALNVLRNNPPPFPPVQTVRKEHKEAPFLWPAFRENRPQWQVVDFQSYLKEGFNRNSLIYSAIMYKVRSLSTAPLRAYSGNSTKPELLDDNHPLAALVRRPNSYQSGQEFMNINEVYLNVAGNSYVMLDRPKRGALPTAMYPLRPDRVVIIPQGRTLKGYVYVPENKSMYDGVPILPEDMMHVRLPNPGDPLEGMGYGMSPFAAMAQSADVDNSVTAFLKLFFDRGAAPNVYIKVQNDLDDDVVARMRERFMEMYGGYENWIGPAVMDNGGEIELFGHSFKEMGFDAIDDRNESRVLGPFGVPGVLIGTRLGLNRAINANAVELRKSFWQDTMLPEMSWYEVEYQHRLEMNDGNFVAFDTSGVPALSPDKVAAVAAFVSLVNIGIPKNIAASFLDIEFDDALPDGDIVYMSPALSPVANPGEVPQSQPVAAPPTQPALPAPRTETDEQTAEAIAKMLAPYLRLRKYSDDQSRDDDGRFSDGGGGADSGSDSGDDSGTRASGSSGGSSGIGAQAGMKKAKAAVEKAGVPPSKVVYGGQGEDFIVGGVAYETAGSYSPNDNKITLYDGAFTGTAKEVEGMASHEAQHYKFEAVQNKAVRQGDKIDMNLDKYTDEKGNLKPEYHEKFPAYHVIDKINNDKAYTKELRAKDGITGYSKSYWRQAGKGFGGYRWAVDETLAEVARMRVRGQGHRVPKIWSDLHDEIDAAYRG